MMSMFLIFAAGIADRSLTVVGIPSIRTRMLELPLMEITSLEIVTEDAELSTSIAEPLDDDIFAEALMLVRSSEAFCASVLAVTTTSSRRWVSSSRIILPRLRLRPVGEMFITFLIYPMNSTESSNSFDEESTVRMNLPLSFVTPPVAILPSSYNTAEAYEMASPFVSTTVPVMLHLFCPAAAMQQRDIISVVIYFVICVIIIGL